MKYPMLSALIAGVMAFGTDIHAEETQGPGDESASLSVSNPTVSNLTVSMPIMDDDPENGIEHPLVEFVRHWSELADVTIEMQRLPFKRSIMHAQNGLVDLHFPLLRDPEIANAELPFDYSTSRITTVNFVLYSRVDEPVDLSQAENYTIATFGGHSDLFPFKVHEEYSIEGSLLKLKNGRIDAYIFADSGGDLALIELGLTGIKRELYKVYDVHAVLPKGTKGGQTDRLITEIMDKVNSGTQPVEWQNAEYVDWQVSDSVIPRVVQK